MTKELQEIIKQFEEKAGAGWLKRLERITTTDELIKMGTEYHITLSEIQAQEGLKFLKNEANELTEKELAGIAGGIGSTTETTTRPPRRKMDP